MIGTASDQSFTIFLEYLNADICPHCGRQNCPYFSRVFQKIRDFLKAGNIDAAKKLYIQYSSLLKNDKYRNKLPPPKQGGFDLIGNLFPAHASQLSKEEHAKHLNLFKSELKKSKRNRNHRGRIRPLFYSRRQTLPIRSLLKCREGGNRKNSHHERFLHA